LGAPLELGPGTRPSELALSTVGVGGCCDDWLRREKKFPAGGLRRPSGSERLKGGEEDGAARAPPPWECAGGGMGGGQRHEGGRAVGGHQGRRKKIPEREGGENEKKIGGEHITAKFIWYHRRFEINWR